VKSSFSVGNIARYDKSGMLEIIESFPEQCQDAKRIGYEFRLPNGFRTRYNNIVCAGLGGSAIGADLVRSYLADQLKVPLFVSRNYGLPGFTGKDTLVLISSYSGNTEETLSAYHDAKARSSNMVVITSGGRLSRLAMEDDVPVVNIPAGLPPRAAFGYSFFPILILLSGIGAIKDQAFYIDDAIKNLKRLKNERLGHKVEDKENQAKSMASRLYGKFPVIYASEDRMGAVATRWRGQFAENSKTLASSNVFPEMSHNEIVGWENPRQALKDSAVIMLKDRSDDPSVSKRMQIVKRMLKKKGVDVIDVNSTGKELLGRIFSLVYIADFVSFYLAILNKVDPTPIESITYLKKELAK
jgi:glucose/mannose-6-phosphate isomerase